MKPKGFTLIELLAVIVILAIIALIATPIVLNIIKDSKESATLQSAQFYLDAVETAVAQKIIDEPTFKPKTCDIQEDGNIKCDETLVEVEINGEVPTSGTITLYTGKIKEVELVLSEKTIVKNTEGKLIYEEPPAPLQSGLYDEEDNLIASWEELVNDYKINVSKNYNASDQTSPGSIFLTTEFLSKGVKLVIDSSISTIGANSFRECTSLVEIIIPNSVTSIGHAAFYNCTNLTNVTIGNSVTSIETYAFESTSLTEVTLPNSVTSIGGGAFRGCIGLTKINIPNNVTSIGESVFEKCNNLTEIVIPMSVTAIGRKAFARSGLIEIIIPSSVSNIDYSAFWLCTNLKEVTIPNSVTSIGDYAFCSCYKLKTINYIGTQEEWNSIQLGIDWNDSMPSDYTINYNYVNQ